MVDVYVDVDAHSGWEGCGVKNLFLLHPKLMALGYVHVLVVGT